MTWMHNGALYAPKPEELAKLPGFVYRVVEKSTGRSYIGERSSWSFRKAPGAKRRTKSESDWRRYNTSNAYLKKAMRQNPGDYEKTIVHLCKTLPEMHFREVEELFKKNSLYDPLSLNENIAGRWFAKNIQSYLK